MIVNSAADWGRSDPLQGGEDGEAMRAGRFQRGRGRQGRVAEPDRVLRAERPARARGGRATGRRDLRGQLHPARGAAGIRAFRHPDGSVVHLAYCTNVHPAEDVDGHRRSARHVRRPRAPSSGWSRLGVGLWSRPRRLPRLATRGRSTRCARRSTRSGLEVVTLNGFPYGAFHAPVVKHAVYRPDWTEPARLDYTLELARLLAALLPRMPTGGASRRCRWLARAVGRGASGPRARRSLDAARGSLPPRRADRPARPRRHSSPSPAASSRPRPRPRALLADVDAGLDRHLSGRLPPRGPVRGPGGGASAALAPRGPGRQDAGVQRAARRRPAPSGRRALRGFAEPRFLHQTRERRRRRGRRRRPRRGPRRRAARRQRSGASTSTCRVHAGRAAAEHHAAGAARRRCGAASAGRPRSPTTSRSRPTPGACCPEASGPRRRRPGRGIARELAWTRERLVELGLEEVT